MFNLSICGQGFVGSAIKSILSEKHKIHTYDKFLPEKSTVKSIEELCSKAKIVFVCVPTPMRLSDGSCDTSIVEEVVGEIARANKKNIAVIRSTVSLGTTARLNREHEGIDVIFQPEFLREAHAEEDMRNQTRIVLGGDLGKELLMRSKGPLTQISLMYRQSFPEVPILTTNHTTAEMVKYTTNVFLATKVSLSNELYQICGKVGINYEDMIRIAQHDERLGLSHWQVPGPMPDQDGNLKPGFSGSCFCKDLNALISISEGLGVDPKMMKAAWTKNLEVRPERDWEQLIGRAIINK